MALSRPRRTVGRVLGGLVLMVVLLAALGLLLPRHLDLVDTEAVVEAPASALFPLFNSRRGQQRLWTHVWDASEESGSRIPPMRIVDLGGPDAGVGSRLGFYPDGRKLGSIVGAVSTLARGKGEVVASQPWRVVVFTIDFGFASSHRTIELEAVDERTTRMRWSESLDIGNPLLRYARFFLSDSIGDGFGAVLEAAGDLARSGRQPTDGERE